MATTKFWPIKGTGKNLQYVITYIENPEKTIPSEEKDVLKTVMQYAVNEDKTEHSMYVSGVNCSTDNAYNEFMYTKQQFSKEDGALAWHGYMSFKAGEVTAEQAHAIGIEFANKNFTDFQVVVATHLNTDCYHNHFVVNSVSYKDGHRAHDEVSWFRYHHLVDRICKEHSLSVVKRPERNSEDSHFRRLDSEGRNESYNLLRKAIDDAISVSRDIESFRRRLKEMGYRYNLSPNRKYWTVTPAGMQRGIRLYHLGENYTNSAIMERLADNQKKIMYKAVTVKVTKYEIKRYTGSRLLIVSLYRYYKYLLNSVKSNPDRTYHIPHWIRSEVSKLQLVSAESNFLDKNNITSMSELLDYKKICQDKTDKLVALRNNLRNDLRRKGSDEKKIKSEITGISSQLSGLRRELKMCDDIQNRSTTINKSIDEINNIEERSLEDGTRGRDGYTDSSRDYKDYD